MTKLNKSKKIVVVLLLICLVFMMAGCTTANLDADGNYIVNQDSMSAKIVGTILDGLHVALSYIQVDNYVYAIILLTLLVKVATTPLNIKQQKSMKAMQAMQPKMKEISKKYENNPQKKQEEVAKLYSDAKINPLSGCLPLLIQMPILFVLFYGLRNWIPAETAITAGHYSFFWIQDLSITVKNTTWPWILPIGCALVTMVQQYMSTTNRQDMTQKMMLILMPAMFLFMTQQFPAALAIYWLFYGLFTMLQTSYLNYKYKAGIFAPKEEKTKSKITMAAEMYDKEQEKKEKVQQKHDDKQSHGRHEATHNLSQKNADVIAGSEGSSERNQKDKPWQ